MGACSFMTTATGATAREAFASAQREARHEHGHGGYSGTIAEKGGFVSIACPAGVDAREHANALLASDDERISDKWGPAGCIALGGGKWLFFGYASS